MVNAKIQNGVFTIDGGTSQYLQVHAVNPPRYQIGSVIYIPLVNDGSPIQVVDIRGLTGIGALIDGSATRVHGSAQDDEINASVGGWFQGGGGSDIMFGSLERDILWGGDGADTINGGGGDDTLKGGRGDDRLDGGNGPLDRGDSFNDVAEYSGNRADYDLKVQGNGYVLTDLRVASPDGTDFLTNIEHLRFKDGTVDLPAPTNLTATIQDGVFTVDGAALGTVLVDASPPDVFETGNGIRIQVEDDGSPIEVVDLRGLLGFGAHIGTDAARVYGSGQDDRISLSPLAESGGWLQGRDGADTLNGSLGRDVLWGGNGADTIDGGGGDDTLKGGSGNDRLEGGAGFNVAEFSGDRADYDLKAQGNGFVLTDLRGRSPDGTDTLVNIQQLRFKDQTVDLAVPTELTATIQDGVFTIAGNAFGYVDVEAAPSPGPNLAEAPYVNHRGLFIPIENDGSPIEVVDARGLSGTAVNIHANAARIYGSARDDVITAYSGSGSWIQGGDGDDGLTGSSGRDVLWGGNGVDIMNGSDGNDTLRGGRGDDELNGGAGFDIADFSGNRADYDLRIRDDGFVLTDRRQTSFDGVDFLLNIEQLRFKDGTFDLV